MKQSETISFVVGVGAATIYETSNNKDNPLPRLTLMQPWCQGYGEEPPIPAGSMTLHAASVRQLYNALHAYYTANAGKGSERSSEKIPSPRRTTVCEFQLLCFTDDDHCKHPSHIDSGGLTRYCDFDTGNQAECLNFKARAVTANAGKEGK